MHKDLETKIDALLKKGLEAKDEKGCTPLLLACESGDFEYAKGLLQKGANVNVRSNDGRSPLLIALEKGQTDFAILLIGSGADVAVLLHSKYMTREFLVNHPELVRMMSTGGVTAEIMGTAPVMNFADMATDAQAFNAFIEAGNVTPGSAAAYECLSAAAKTGNATAIDLLFKQNPDVDLAYRYEKKKTLLMYAVQNKNEDESLEVTKKVFEMLKRQCAKREKSPEAKNKAEEKLRLEGKPVTPENVDKEVKKQIEAYYAEVVNAVDEDGKTALDTCKSVKVAAYILEQGGMFGPESKLTPELKERLEKIYPDREITEEFFATLQLKSDGETMVVGHIKEENVATNEQDKPLSKKQEENKPAEQKDNTDGIKQPDNPNNKKENADNRNEPFKSKLKRLRQKFCKDASEVEEYKPVANRNEAKVTDLTKRLKENKEYE